MNLRTLVSSFLFLAFLSPVMADRQATPFEWHGTATRVHPKNGSILGKDTPYCSPEQAMAPILYVYNKMESPSAGASSKPSGFSKCLGVLCPVNWFKRAPREEAMAAE